MPTSHRRHITFITGECRHPPPDCRKSRILTGRRGRRPLQMAILRIMNVGANCVRPQTTMFIDNLRADVGIRPYIKK